MRKELSSKAKALLAAADWLEGHEWSHRDTFFVYDDDYNIIGGCAVGAIRVALGVADAGASFAPLNRIGIGVNERAHLISFNDAQGRTKEEVVAHLRELALTA